MSLPTIVSFWHGPMSWLERLSISSFVQAGHSFDLYSYDPIDLPDGATNRNAEEIVPREGMFFYKGNRSPAVFADYFRLQLLAKDRGIWADCDVICLDPFENLSDYIFGFEADPDQNGKGGQINNAVLGMPAHSELLGALLAIFESENREVDPVWMPWFRRTEYQIRRLAGRPVGLEHLQFGATGPYPLTYFAKQLGLFDKALSARVFYPVTYEDISQLAQSGSQLERHIYPETLALHAWRMGLTDRGRHKQPPPPQPGSALAQLCKRFGCDA